MENEHPPAKRQCLENSSDQNVNPSDSIESCVSSSSDCIVSTAVGSNIGNSNESVTGNVLPISTQSNVTTNTKDSVNIAKASTGKEESVNDITSTDASTSSKASSQISSSMDSQSKVSEGYTGDSQSSRSSVSSSMVSSDMQVAADNKCNMKETKGQATAAIKSSTEEVSSLHANELNSNKLISQSADAAQCSPESSVVTCVADSPLESLTEKSRSDTLKSESSIEVSQSSKADSASPSNNLNNSESGASLTSSDSIPAKASAPTSLREGCSSTATASEEKGIRNTISRDYASSSESFTENIGDSVAQKPSDILALAFESEIGQKSLEQSNSPDVSQEGIVNVNSVIQQDKKIADKNIPSDERITVLDTPIDSSLENTCTTTVDDKKCSVADGNNAATSDSTSGRIDDSATKNNDLSNSNESRGQNADISNSLSDPDMPSSTDKNIFSLIDHCESKALEKRATTEQNQIIPASDNIPFAPITAADVNESPEKNIQVSTADNINHETETVSDTPVSNIDISSEISKAAMSIKASSKKDEDRTSATSVIKFPENIVGNSKNNLPDIVPEVEQMEIDSDTIAEKPIHDDDRMETEDRCHEPVHPKTPEPSIFLDEESCEAVPRKPEPVSNFKEETLAGDPRLENQDSSQNSPALCVVGEVSDDIKDNTDDNSSNTKDKDGDDDEIDDDESASKKQPKKRRKARRSVYYRPRPDLKRKREKERGM